MTGTETSRAGGGSCGGPIPTAATRPAWDTRCAAGCGERVLEAGVVCSDCLCALVDAESARRVARVRREWVWVWVLGKERQR